MALIAWFSGASGTNVIGSAELLCVHDSCESRRKEGRWLRAKNTHTIWQH